MISATATAEVSPFVRLPDVRARALAWGTELLLGWSHAGLGDVAEAALQLLAAGPQMLANASAVSEQEMEAWQQLMGGEPAARAAESTTLHPAPASGRSERTRGF
jgi:hypothetical protein